MISLKSPETESVGLQDLIDTLKTNTYIPQRDVKGPFIFSVDHCFSIRGQGTVMTGTALSGGVSVNDVSNFLVRSTKAKIVSHCTYTTFFILISTF